MLSNRNAIIDADECVLDTSATPSTMSEEEAEYAGNRNVAWNVNLLLFLHRIGFIDLLDASFVPEKKAYTVKVKLLRTDVLGDSERLSEAFSVASCAPFHAHGAFSLSKRMRRTA